MCISTCDRSDSGIDGVETALGCCEKEALERNQSCVVVVRKRVDRQWRGLLLPVHGCFW